MNTLAEPSTLEDLVPQPHFRERHERHIAAPPSAVWDALHALALADVPLSRTLMALRSLPARLLGQPRSGSATARLLEDGPLPVLASDFERSVLAGAAMQPWKLAGGAVRPALDADGLRAFEQPGWVKAATDFMLEPDRDGTLLSTETRVRATDARSRRRFGLYWLAIRAGSGIVRRDLLREVSRRAEAAARERIPESKSRSTSCCG